MAGRTSKVRRAVAVVAAGVVAGVMVIAGGGPAAAADPLTWEGQSWTVVGGTAEVVAGNAVLTRTATGEVGLRADLPDTINDDGTPWVEFTYVDDGSSMQGFDAFVNPDVSSARLSGGSLFDCDGLGYSRYSVPAIEQVDVALGPNCGPDLPGTSRTPAAHTVYVGQRADGTIDWQFDGVWQEPSTFLQDASPTSQAPFDFTDVFLRWRSSEMSGTATFTGFAFGDDHAAVPDGGIRAGLPGAEFKQFGFTSPVATGAQTAKDTAPVGTDRSFKFRVENIGEFPAPSPSPVTARVTASGSSTTTPTGTRSRARCSTAPTSSCSIRASARKRCLSASSRRARRRRTPRPVR